MSPSPVRDSTGPPEGYRPVGRTRSGEAAASPRPDDRLHLAVGVQRVRAAVPSDPAAAEASERRLHVAAERVDPDSPAPCSPCPPRGASEISRPEQPSPAPVAVMSERDALHLVVEG